MHVISIIEGKKVETLELSCQCFHFTAQASVKQYIYFWYLRT
jgi:hypothetical protein